MTALDVDACGNCGLAHVSTAFSPGCVTALAAEVTRLREQSSQLQNRLLGAATVLPDLTWKEQLAEARAERDEQSGAKLTWQGRYNAAVAERDALAHQLKAATFPTCECEQLRSQVAELTSERDGYRKAYEAWHGIAKSEHGEGNAATREYIYQLKRELVEQANSKLDKDRADQEVKL